MEVCKVDPSLGGVPEPLRRLMTFERFHLHKPNEYQRWYEGVDPAYFPQNCRAFELPCYWVERRRMYLFGLGAEPRNPLTELFSPPNADQVLFPIHPLSVPYYAEFLNAAQARRHVPAARRFWALPTSSPRTLLVWPDDEPSRAGFIKMTMLLPPTCGDWRIHRSRAAYAVGVSRVLALASGNDPIGGIRYFLETGAMVPRGLTQAGAIFRSVPQAVCRGDPIVAPLFALIGGEGEHRPLLLTLFQEYGVNPMQFVEETLCSKFCSSWLQNAFQYGFYPEAHGQNLLIEFSSDMRPTGFAYKDIEGLTVDWDIRAQLGISEVAELPMAHVWGEIYSAMFPREPYWSMVSRKMGVSLNAYLSLFLRGLGEQMIAWHRAGLIAHGPHSAAEVTRMFSSEMRRMIQSLFGFSIDDSYDAADDVNRFAADLVRLRGMLAKRRTPGVRSAATE